jgi:LuxR family maltose regulon positive regulatory protein
LGLLRPILAAAEVGHRDGNAIEALALLALGHDAAGDTAHALATLEEALTRAAGEGFVRTFLDAGAPMIALLKAAVRHGRAADRAAAVLAGVDGMPLKQHGLVDELSSRELDVLRLLRSDLSGPEIAAELVVSINTVRTHTKNIFLKLGVNSRRAALRRAEELGL